MSRKTKLPRHLLLKDQAATILIAATYQFLRRNSVSKRTIRGFGDPSRVMQKYSSHLRSYRRMMQTYEYMGVLVATWFANPKFLDKSGKPLELTASTGRRSVANLIRASGVPISRRVAIELMRCSPSVKCSDDGGFTVLRKVFVLPEFEVPRAALVVERYLDTLNGNALGRKLNSTLLERSCHVTDIDLQAIAPILRDIKERGTAFMDSVDGEIEACRLPRQKRGTSGEIGVAVFAWTKPK